MVPEAEAPKGLAQSIPKAWPARVSSFGQDFLGAIVAKKHVEDFLSSRTFLLTSTSSTSSSSAVKEPKPLAGKREKGKSHCRVCGEPGKCGQGTHSLCVQPLKGRLPPSSPSFDLNVDQHQVLAPRTPRRSGAVLGPPAHSPCGHRTVLYSACPARAARDADVLVAFANRACA